MTLAGLFSICVLVVPISIGIFLVVTGRRSGGGGEGPQCGHCGYNLTGAPENRCPECGKLFIDAGVVTIPPKGSRVRFWIGVALIAVPGLLGTVGSVTSMMYVRARQAQQRAMLQSLLTPTVTAEQQAAAAKKAIKNTAAATRSNENAADGKSAKGDSDERANENAAEGKTAKGDATKRENETP